MNPIPGRSLEWEHYLTRPFSLFGTSMWQAWYDSDLIRELIGASMPDALFIEEHTDVFRSYREKGQLEAFRAAIEHIVREEPERMASIFEKAFDLNIQAKEAIQAGSHAYRDLDEVIHAGTELALHAAVIPALALPVIDTLKTEDDHLRTMAEMLRSVSYYPDFNTRIIMPSVMRVLQGSGADASLAPFVTVKELHERDFSALAARAPARRAGQRFVYEISGADEHITLVDDPMGIIRTLEHLPLPDDIGHEELRGQIAYRGKARGIARVIFSNDMADVEFEEGDILVSINSTPILMPLILKSAAIVTDEGGVGCHAAIVARELKKPCVIGTRYATTFINDGNLVAVDATMGVVRIIA